LRICLPRLGATLYPRVLRLWRWCCRVSNRSATVSPVPSPRLATGLSTGRPVMNRKADRLVLAQQWSRTSTSTPQSGESVGPVRSARQRMGVVSGLLWSVRGWSVHSGASSGSSRASRGDSWFGVAQYERAASRDGHSTDYRYDEQGFRLVRCQGDCVAPSSPKPERFARGLPSLRDFFHPASGLKRLSGRPHALNSK